MEAHLSARFLAVACYEKNMTWRQARQVLDAQRKIARTGVEVPPAGELACNAGILSEDQVVDLVEKQTSMQMLGQEVTDPLYNRPKFRRVWFTVHRLLGVIGLIIAGAIYRKTGDFGHVAVWLSVLAGLVMTVRRTVPDIFYRPISIAYIYSILVMLLVPFSFGYAIFVVDKLHNMASDPMSDELWRNFAVGMFILAISWVALSVNARWRHREIWYSEARGELTNRLVRYVHDSSGVINETIVLDFLHEAARILSVNPWRHAMRAALRGISIILRSRPNKFFNDQITIWYFEPIDGAKFKTRFYQAYPSLTQHARAALDKIAKDHQPAFFDEEKLRSKWVEISKLDGSTEPNLLHIPDRHENISICGKVFAEGRLLESSNTKYCAAFDNNYLQTMNFDDTVESLKTRETVEIRSFIACPVTAAVDQGGGPIGVLLACCNSVNGFTPDDRNTVVLTSRLLSHLV